MEVSILTYNVLYNKGYEQIETILDKYQPDILNLQEVQTSDKNLQKLATLGYALADYSNSFIFLGRIFGVATFYKKNKFRVLGTESIPLSRSAYEFVTSIVKILKGKSQCRSILKVIFETKSKKRLTIYNAHLSVIGTNGVRIRQLRQALHSDGLNSKNPLIFTGDFNYPYNRKGLERLMLSHQLKEATRNIAYTFAVARKADYTFLQILLFKLVKKFYQRYKLDYIFYKHLHLKKTERLNVTFSDHFPIFSIFTL